ncbi:MAG: tRNA 2-thiouridine(34) synthase MnmA [Oscillospiraceae bacterium]|nr:tRNA 2-thiouridine(34) synthase MnmA [Oscillospiraceae bacterium]
MAEKVLAAMSGGVDSSVAAYLLDKRGFDVSGAMMKLYENEDIGEDIMRSCCSLADKGDAEAVAARLGIPFYVFNYTEEFRRGVMDAFVDEYAHGHTPNPCVECNRLLKFGALFERADALGCKFIATGHYVRVERDAGGRYLLKKGVDDTKDQSYALFFMTQEQLARTVFPLGELTKTEVRELARENGFENAAKPDSQDICFVPRGDYGEFLETYTGKTPPPGDFLDKNGKILGTHRGISRYTVGQRRGLGISDEHRLYVTRIDTAKNAVILGENADLYSRELMAKNINIIAGELPEQEFRCTAKIRYGMREQPATATRTGEDELKIVFDTPQRAITPGQYAVLYDNDIVIGGGTIQ